MSEHRTVLNRLRRSILLQRFAGAKQRPRNVKTYVAVPAGIDCVPDAPDVSLTVRAGADRSALGADASRATAPSVV
jgi:hypothetical protein